MRDIQRLMSNISILILTNFAGLQPLRVHREGATLFLLLGLD